MKNLATAGLLIATLCAPLGAQQLPAGALRVDVVEIMDPAGFARPMIAARALVPSGWRSQGGVQWATRPCQEPATFAWSATAPDGMRGIELFPAQVWGAGSSGSGDCTPGAYRSMREYLEAYVQGRIPGARVVDYRPRADFVETNRAYYDGMIQLVNQSGIAGMRAWADAGEVLYAFQLGGVEMRGVASAAGMFYSSELANPLGGAPLWSLSASTHGVFSAYAPNGQLDFAAVEAIRKSVKPDTAWLQELFKVKLAIGAENVRATRERAAIIVAGGAAMTQSTIQANQMATRNYADVSAGSSSSSTSATDDRMQRERIEAIRGVETYHDPLEGGTVQLDATFDHAWRINNQQSYILTNDPNFNPGQYDIDARQLAVVQ
jgi:hypothetical protein